MIDMDARLADMPVMAHRSDVIDAKMYNLWQHCKRHIGQSAVLNLPGLKTLRFIVSSKYWVVADSANYYVPVLAWLDFKDENRDNLHKPVECRVNYYHFAASAVRSKSLELAFSQLEEKLKLCRGNGQTGKIITPGF